MWARRGEWCICKMSLILKSDFHFWVDPDREKIIRKKRKRAT
jgi:hypothetical protein